MKIENITMQDLLDVADFMYLVLDKNQKVVLINRKGCEILGYTENEILGKNWFVNFLPKRIAKELKKSFELVLADLSQLNSGGIEFIQAIQRINSEIKCIIMTSYSEEIYPAGIQLLVKPFSNIQLVECIRRTLALSEIQATEEKVQLSFDENPMSMSQIFSYDNQIRGYVQ